MSGVCCRGWNSKQDVIDEYAARVRCSGYDVRFEGNWVYAEKNGKPADLIYLNINKLYGVWGYKEISVSCGPSNYNAPLWMVLKIHHLFSDDRFYQGWLGKYPKRNAVLENYSRSFTPPLFEGAA